MRVIVTASPGSTCRLCGQLGAVLAWAANLTSEVYRLAFIAMTESAGGVELAR